MPLTARRKKFDTTIDAALELAGKLGALPPGAAVEAQNIMHRITMVCCLCVLLNCSLAAALGTYVLGRLLGCALLQLASSPSGRVRGSGLAGMQCLHVADALYSACAPCESSAADVAGKVHASGVLYTKTLKTLLLRAACGRTSRSKQASGSLAMPWRSSRSLCPCWRRCTMSTSKHPSALCTGHAPVQG